MLKERGEQRKGPLAREATRLHLDKLSAIPPEFLVMPLLKGQVCLISQGQFDELVRPSTSGTFYVDMHQ